MSSPNDIRQQRRLGVIAPVATATIPVVDPDEVITKEVKPKKKPEPEAPKKRTPTPEPIIFQTIETPRPKKHPSMVKETPKSSSKKGGKR